MLGQGLHDKNSAVLVSMGCHYEWKAGFIFFCGELLPLNGDTFLETGYPGDARGSTLTRQPRQSLISIVGLSFYVNHMFALLISFI